jgi:hypothetical protein
MTSEGERYWSLVERLADAVRDNATLTWDQANAILNVVTNVRSGYFVA